MPPRLILLFLLLSGCAAGGVGETGAPLGAICEIDDACASGICVALPEGLQVCAEPCVDGACDAQGYLCEPSPEGGYCVPNLNGGGLAPPPNDGTLRTCGRGETRDCFCDDGVTQSMQLCRADGLGFGDCACGLEDFGAPPPPRDGGVPPPVGMDAGPPPPPMQDAAPPPPPMQDAGPPPGPDPAELPPQGFQNCASVLQCGNGCGNNQACFDQCFSNGTWSARADYLNLVRCINRTGCRTEQDCRNRCGSQWSACETDQPNEPVACGAVFYCVQTCLELGEGEFCRDACLELDPGGEATYFALEDCLRQSRCQGLEACDASCGGQLDACLTDR